MPPSKPLCLTLALAILPAALLFAGPAHAEARRAAQSLPAPKRFFSPLRAAPPALMRSGRFAENRSVQGRTHFGSGRDAPSTRGRSERDDDRHHGRGGGRQVFEEAEDRESHHIGHHGHNDSPGC